MHSKRALWPVVLILSFSFLPGCGELTLGPDEGGKGGDLDQLIEQLENGKTLDAKQAAAQSLGEQTYGLAGRRGKENVIKVLEVLHEKLRFGTAREKVLREECARSLCLISSQLMEQRESLYESGDENRELSERIRKDLQSIFSELYSFMGENPKP